MSSKILAKVIEYCKYHVDAFKKVEGEDKPAKSDDEVKTWDTDFVKVTARAEPLLRQHMLLRSSSLCRQ